MLKQTPTVTKRIIAGSVSTLSLRQNAWWSLLGNATYAVCQLGMLVVLARLGSPEQVGLYGWALALTTPIFLLASMQLRTVLAAETESEGNVFGKYLGARLVTTAVVVLLVALGAWQFESRSARLVILSVGLSKAIESVSDVLYGLFWQQDRMDCIAKSMMLRGLLGVAGFSLAYLWFDSLPIAQLTLGAIWLAMLVLYDLPKARQLNNDTGRAKLWPCLRWATVKQLAVLGLPAGILSGLTSLQVNVPRYFVEGIMGTNELGVFTVLAYLLIGIELAARSVNYAAIPKFARLIREANAKEISQLVVRLTLLGVAMGLVVTGGTALLGRQLIGLLYGAEYVPYARLLLYLVAISAVRIVAMPLAMTLRSAKAYWQLALIHGVAVLALSCACWGLVPRYGLEGAALAILVGLLVDIVGRYLCYLRLVRFESIALSDAQKVQMVA